MRCATMWSTCETRGVNRRYRVTEDARSGIRSDPNRADGPNKGDIVK